MGRRAHFLAPGGTFCIIEAHPFAACFGGRRTDDELRLLYDYFLGDEAVRIEHSGSYAAPDAPMRGVAHYFRKRGTNTIHPCRCAGTNRCEEKQRGRVEIVRLLVRNLPSSRPVLTRSLTVPGSIWDTSGTHEMSSVPAREPIGCQVLR